MTRRRTEGRETWARLLEWDRGQAAAERLSAQLLRAEGFQSVDPSHPLGGRDGLKDILCVRDGLRWLGAAYFPRGQQPFAAIKAKSVGDAAGVAVNNVDGIAFITNQELTLSERDEVATLAERGKVELFHLERVSSLLDSPPLYGVRLEFLDVEMTKEEQTAFIASRDGMIERLQARFEEIFARVEGSVLIPSAQADRVREAIPLEEIREFKKVLDAVAGPDPYGALSLASIFGRASSGHINDLRVPLAEMKEFVALLRKAVGGSDPFGTHSIFALGGARGTVKDLRVPLTDLREYVALLDLALTKQAMLRAGERSAADSKHP